MRPYAKYKDATNFTNLICVISGNFFNGDLIQNLIYS